MKIKKMTPLLLILALTACNGESTDAKNEVKEEKTVVEEKEIAEVDEVNEESKTSEQGNKIEHENDSESTDNSEQGEEVPREYRNALRAAENYISFSPFSKQGLYDQLTSEYADQYPAEAAQYAIDNIEVDYKEQALKAAKNYLEIMPYSDAELKEQLMSEYADKFTEEEAQYAIDNLE